MSYSTIYEKLLKNGRKTKYAPYHSSGTAGMEGLPA